MTPPPTTLDSPASIREFVEWSTPEQCRTYHSLYFFLVDEEGRGLMAAAVDDAPHFPTEAECEHAATVFASCVPPAGGMLVLVGRPRPARITDSDRSWLRAVRRVCSAEQVRALGVWIAVPGSVREVTVDDMD